MAIETSVKFINSIQGPLGLPRAIRKVVIVADVGQPLRVFVQSFVNKESASCIADSLTNLPVDVDVVADVVVTDTGEVIVTKKEN